MTNGKFIAPPKDAKKMSVDCHSSYKGYHGENEAIIETKGK